MDSRALTEEHPRTAGQIAADALDVCEEAGNTYSETDGPVCAVAWNLSRLARQVAELAQLVDVVPAEIVDDGPHPGPAWPEDPDAPHPFDMPDPRDDALDLIASALRESDWSGVMYDDDALYEIHAIITGTGRDAGPR